MGNGLMGKWWKQWWVKEDPPVGVGAPDPGGQWSQHATTNSPGSYQVNGEVVHKWECHCPECTQLVDAWAAKVKWVSKYPWGAVGDGVADDTAAVQAMVNAGQVIPPGTYKVTKLEGPPDGASPKFHQGGLVGAAPFDGAPPEPPEQEVPLSDDEVRDAINVLLGTEAESGGKAVIRWVRAQRRAILARKEEPTAVVLSLSAWQSVQRDPLWWEVQPLVGKDAPNLVGLPVVLRPSQRLVVEVLGPQAAAAEGWGHIAQSTAHIAQGVAEAVATFSGAMGKVGVQAQELSSNIKLSSWLAPSHYSHLHVTYPEGGGVVKNVSA